MPYVTANPGVSGGFVGESDAAHRASLSPRVRVAVAPPGVPSLERVQSARMVADGAVVRASLSPAALGEVAAAGYPQSLSVAHQCAVGAVATRRGTAAARAADASTLTASFAAADAARCAAERTAATTAAIAAADVTAQTHAERAQVSADMASAHTATQAPILTVPGSDLAASHARAEMARAASQTALAHIALTARTPKVL